MHGTAPTPIKPTSEFLLSICANASTYAHQTEFYQSVIVDHSGLAHPTHRTGQYGSGRWYNKLIRRHGRRQLQSEAEVIASSSFAQILAE